MKTKINISNENKFFVLPLRNIVIFPKMITHIFVDRIGGIKSLKELTHEDTILLVTQKKIENEEPKASDLYRIGVIAKILQIVKLQGNSFKILVEGLIKAKINKYISRSLSLKANAVPEQDSINSNKELSSLKNATINCLSEYINESKKISYETLNEITQIQDIIDFCNIICSQIQLPINKKQQLLEIDNIEQKLEKLMIYINSEIDLIKTENKIKLRVKSQIEKNQKDYYLQEQLKAIHKELGEEDYKEDFNELKKKIDALTIHQQIRNKAISELKKLKMMSPMSSESTIVRNYLDWIISLPWNIQTKPNKNLQIAEKALDKEHYSLNKIKDRILEYIAVNIKSKKLNGSAICLYGPPGIGKTSLAYSMANATGRKFAKITLGGLRDEAEIKGHRRTYIGAMPGRIIQAIKKAGSSNALILLDEIDKLTHDFRGDPASALLEVLDTSQNKNFSDNYLEVDYDLSNIFFVATANTLDLPYALLDRMEIIKLTGYTEKDKFHIAKNYLIKRTRTSHNMQQSELTINDDAIMDIVKYYTREAGVRNLNREIEKIFRKCIREYITYNKSINIEPNNLTKYLGPRRYTNDQITKKNEIGTCNGLAYTETGGETLIIEAVKYKGKGNIKITGQIGEIMKESVQAAHSYIHSKCKELNLDINIIQNHDIHVHVPEGAIPKDGPSAGITIATAIFSLISGITIRKDIAMTGEITLKGKIIAIGGLKEKLLAAIRSGIKIVIIPKENMKELVEMPSEIKTSLTIIPVEYFDETLQHSLTK